MNNWHKISISYFETATFKALLNISLRTLTWTEIILLFLSILLLLASFFFFSTDGLTGTGLTLEVIGGLNIILLLNHSSSRYTYDNFGKLPSTTKSESKNRMQQRYAMFKISLEKKGIPYKKVSSYFPLLDAKVQLAAESNHLFKTFFSFFIMLLTTFLGAYLAIQHPEKLLFLVVMFTTISMLVMLFLGLTRTHKEKLLEMKMFIHMYSLEK